MWKNIMATAFLVLSVGVTYKLIQSANAQLGPHVSAGQNPIVNYGGSINQGVPVFTAPVDQDVIVTTLITNQSCQIAVDGIVVVPTNNYFYPTYMFTRTAYFQPQTVFTTGKASLKVSAGATLSFDGCNTTTYYIEGYLVHP